MITIPSLAANSELFNQTANTLKLTKLGDVISQFVLPMPNYFILPPLITVQGVWLE